ncbi:MAG TPA: TonB-dependent receptor [Burkholderiaceae bacterium]
MSFKLKVLPLALAQVIAGGAFTLMTAAPVQAQQAASDATVTRVEITGSNIRRADKETPSPVQVITSADLKNSGYTTTAQVLQNITANGQGTLSTGFSGAFAGGATGISLRGLNTSATLVLIDGHRMAPYPLADDNQRAFVDVASIPFDAIEQIEILKDGASAVYGSDAMAGVVNIKLKKSYLGTNVTAEAGTTTEGGGKTGHASIIHGWGNYDEDGYNAYVNLEVRHQDPIRQVQRKGDGLWASTDLSSIGGLNETPGVINPLIPKPSTFGTVYLTDPSQGGFSTANSHFYTSPIIPNSNYSGSCSSLAMLQAGGCAFRNPLAEIQPETQNFNIIGSFSKKLPDDWKLDVKASFFDSKGQQFSGAGSGGGMFNYPASFSPLVAVSAGVLPHLVGTTIPLVSVPQGYPGNPFSGPGRVRGVNPDAPNTPSEFDAKNYRLVADLSGSFGAWDIDGSVGYTRISLDSTSIGENIPVLNAALNAPNGSAGQWAVTGGNPQSLINQVFPTLSATDTSTLEFAELHASRSLMQLSGGDLGFSVGGSYIHRDLHAVAPDLIAQGIVSGNNAFSQGAQTDESLYAEVYAPVLKTLELDGHLRYDHFDNVGSSWTPSAGIKFTPVKEFAVRGTYGKGFRAPNPNESGQAGNAYLSGTTFDPVLCPGGDSTKAGAVISQCNFQPVYQNSSNPSLKSEKSTSETLGVILEPIKGWSSTIDYYSVEIKDQITGGTADISKGIRGPAVTDTCSDGAGSTVTCSASELIYIPVGYVNANSVKVTGLELDTRYKFKLGEMGSLTADLNWSHTISYELTGDYVGNGFPTTYQLAGTHGPAVIGGDTGNPKDRVQATLTWDKGPLTVATTFNYIGSFDLTDPSGSNTGIPINNCADGVANGGGFIAWFPNAVDGGVTYPNAGYTNPQSQYCKVHSFIDTDLTVNYKFDKHWSAHLNVTNLFNQAPPVDLNTYGGGNLPYNPSMHQAGAVGRFVNIGANYKF